MFVLSKQEMSPDPTKLVQNNAGSKCYMYLMYVHSQKKTNQLVSWHETRKKSEL